MSRTRRGSKPLGYDFWSRRSRALNSGKISKWITNKHERARDRKMVNRAMNNPEDFELRFKGE